MKSSSIHIFCTLIFALLLTSLISIKASSEGNNKYLEYRNKAKRHLTAMEHSLQDAKNNFLSIGEKLHNARKQSASWKSIEELEQQKADAEADLWLAQERVRVAQTFYDIQGVMLEKHSGKKSS